MTCRTCSKSCPFRWREWEGYQSVAVGLQANAKVSAGVSQHVNNLRAQGIDMSFLEGIGKSHRVADASHFAV